MEGDQGQQGMVEVTSMWSQVQQGEGGKVLLGLLMLVITEYKIFFFRNTFDHLDMIILIKISNIRGDKLETKLI